MIVQDIISQNLTEICRALGLIGCGIYICGFFLLSLGKIDSKRPLYFAMNLTAASLVMISLSADFNLASAVIQGFYICVSIIAITLRLSQMRKSQPPQPRRI